MAKGISSGTLPTNNATIDGAETLSNKTLDSSNTFSGSVENPSRLDAKKDTFAALQTYAASAQNGELVYATDVKKFYVITDGALEETGGGGAGAGSVEIDVNQVAHGFSVFDPIVHNGTEWALAISNSEENLEQYVIVEVTDVDNFKAAKFGKYAITIPDKTSFAGETVATVGESAILNVGINEYTLEKLTGTSSPGYNPSDVYVSNLIKKMYFQAPSPSFTDALYELDLVTLEHTVLFDSLPGLPVFDQTNTSYYSEGTNKVYFYAEDSNGGIGYTYSFDPSDPSGTIAQVTELGTSPTRRYLHVDGLGLFFESGSKLYLWDYVSPSSTLVFSDINGFANYSPSNLSIVTNPFDSTDYLFFTATENGLDRKLYYSDAGLGIANLVFTDVDGVTDYATSRAISTSSSIYFIANDSSGKRLYSWDGDAGNLPNLEFTTLDADTNYAAASLDLFYDSLNDAVVFNGTNSSAPLNIGIYTWDGTVLTPYVDSYIKLRAGSDIIVEPSLSVGSRYFLSSDVSGQYSTEDNDAGFSSPLFYIEDQNTVHIEAYRPVEIVDKAEDTEVISVVRAAYSDLSDLIDTNGTLLGSIPTIENNGPATGTLSIPTSGNEAISSHLDSHRVFKWESASGSRFDSFGSFFFIPNSHRGNSLTFGFDYRTERTTGSSVDEDYGLWIINETSSVVHYSSDSGVILSGSNINFDSTTGFNVSDVVYIRQTDNSIVVANITDVTPTTIQVDQNVNLPSFNATFMTGVLYADTLSAADDDLTKNSTRLEVNFTCPSDCEKIVYFFQQLTNASDSFIFIDNIFVKNSELKTVLAREPSLSYSVEESGSSMASSGNIAGAIRFGSPTTTADANIGDYLVADHSADPSTWTAQKKIKVDVDFHAIAASNGRSLMIAVNGTVVRYGSVGSPTTTNVSEQVNGTLILNKGDYITVGIGNSGANPPVFDSSTILNNSANEVRLDITVTPEVNDVVVVESTDSVISEWTDFTPTGLWTTNTTYTGKWRRVGDTMQVSVNASLSGAPNAGNMYFDLPSGYVIDTSKLSDTTVGIGFLGSGTAHDSGTGSETIEIRYKDTTSVYAATYDGSSYIGATVPFTWTSADDLNAYFEVPISGWDANPKPLLSFPTVTYGQDAEYFNSGLVTDFWDSTALSDTFDESLITGLSDSLLLSVVNAGGDDRITATQDIVLHVSVSGSAMNAGQRVEIYDYNNKLIAYGTGDASVTSNDSASGTVRLNAGQYVWVRRETASSRTGGISLTASPLQGVTNQAAIIAQPVAYARYNTSSANFGITGTNTVPLNTIDGDIAACSLSLSGSDFVLQPGKYDIEWYGYIAPSSSDKIAATALYNVTDSVELRRGTLVYGNVSGEIYTTSHGSHQITITKPTTFRYQAILVQGSTGSINFGASFAAPNSEKGVVKITRKK